MILCVDIGNTNIVFGVFKDNELLFTSRISTDKRKMADEYLITLSTLLSFNNCNKDEFSGAIISSVVPPLTQSLKQAISSLLDCNPYTISPGVKTGLNIKIDNPAVLGADLVCAAVGAINKYPTPAIILDLGTATKISAIDKNKDFLGVSILPGVTISLEALSSGAAQLPFIDLSDVTNVIGKNTNDSMKSGIVFGNASMLDGMIEKFSKEMDCVPTVIATGGIAKVITKYCTNPIIVDEDLILHGLLVIYNKNS